MTVSGFNNLSVNNYAKRFGDRLNKVLDYIGMKKHGRLTILSDWLGITVGGVRLLFTSDRPPKQNKYDELVNRLLKEIYSIKGDISISSEDLSLYLLHGNSLPIFVENKNDDSFNISLESLENTKIVLMVSDVGRKVGIDTLNDITESDLLNIQSKISNHIKNKNLNIKDEKVGTLVEAMLKLACENLL